MSEVERSSEMSEFICRVCREDVNIEEARDSLLSPCLCSGSMAFIHQTCYDQLRSDRCGTCKMRYVPGPPSGGNSQPFLEDPDNQIGRLFRLDENNPNVLVEVIDNDLLIIPEGGLEDHIGGLEDHNGEDRGQFGEGRERLREERDEEWRVMLQDTLQGIPPEIEGVRAREIVAIAMESELRSRWKLGIYLASAMLVSDVIYRINSLEWNSRWKILIKSVQLPINWTVSYFLFWYMMIFYWFDDHPKAMNGHGKWCFIGVLSILGGIIQISPVLGSKMLAAFLFLKIFYEGVLKRWVIQPIGLP